MVKWLRKAVMMSAGVAVGFSIGNLPARWPMLLLSLASIIIIFADMYLEYTEDMMRELDDAHDPGLRADCEDQDCDDKKET